ncbi:MAG: Thioredoxin-1 [bacterium ADurb.Bin429]|nr:MAG: Thioredoxin-1 [bacterium ADurb.Bin429]
MSELVRSVTAEAFDGEALRAETPVVVDFWAAWCGPCRMVAPELEKAAEQLGGRAKILKVNVDEQPALAAKYGVMSIPTLVILHRGQEIGRHVGFLPATALVDALTQYLGAAA